MHPTKSTPVDSPRRFARVAVALAALDAFVTIPFVHLGPAEGDTIRYALDLERWRLGEKALGALFNGDVCFGSYTLARAVAGAFSIDRAGLSTVFNGLSCAAGIAATGSLSLVIARRFGLGAALIFGLLLITAPGWWMLHLYGNPNIIGLAFAAAAWACLTPSGPRVDLTPLRAVLGGLLGAAALCARTDVAMLAPAIVAASRLGPRPVAWRWLGLAALTALAGFGVGCLVAGAPLPLVGNVGRHVDANLGGKLRWTAQNLAFLATGLPPLVAIAAAAAFFAARGDDGRRSRRLALVWLVPALVFVIFGRVPLTRILAPLWPAALLPLAVGLASLWPLRPRRRLFAVGLLIVAAHVTAALTPRAIEAVSGRSLEGRGVGHFYFLGSMGAERERVARHFTALERDARRALESTLPGETTAIVGGDGIAYLWTIAASLPRFETKLLGTAYATRLEELRDPVTDRRWWFLSLRPGAEPLAVLESFGLPAPTRVWVTTSD